MSLARFYLPQWDEKALTRDEAKHCTQVMRHQVGDRIRVFDGKGEEAEAEIASISSKRVEFHILSQHHTPSPSVSISLLQAVPKGANMELIIEKAVELGVNAIHPVLTERTVVKLDAKDALKKQEKWQRVALEACKQCGQNWLPEVHLPKPFLEVLRELPPYEVKIIAAIQPDSQSLNSILSGGNPTSAALCIGPEGDFTPAEYTAARASGFAPMTLGPLVLRVETATLYAVSVLSHELRGDSHARPAFSPKDT
jgi:16S rRNA (uracil1498-N3)-methyltransferase